MTDNTHNKWQKFQNENEESLHDADHENFEDDMELAGGDKKANEESETASSAAAEPASSLEHLTYGELEKQLTVAEQKAHENREKATRAIAELDNVRRRAERDVANAHRYGVEKLLTGLLPIADSLEQALQVASHDPKIAEGIELTMKLLLDTLEKQGVKQIDPTGEPFNPQEHEAMSIQQTEEVPPNTVLTVFQKGYRLHDRVIRPARVVVSKGKPA